MTETISIGKTTDGRRKRSEASHRQIIQAMLELIGNGDISPSAEAVATCAGVGLRTVFRHFDNMESLFQEINTAMADELRSTTVTPYNHDCWRDQLTEMLERRAQIFERILPFKIAADIHRHRSTFLDRQAKALMRDLRNALAALLPARIHADGMLFQSLELLLSFDTWRHLRREQKLSAARAKTLLEKLVTALLKIHEEEND